MKRYILSMYFILSFIFSSAQVAIVDYMYVKPENEENYLEIEQKWKEVHQERVKYNTIKGWYFYKVKFAGTESPYQYVVVTVYNSFDDSENLYFEGSFDKAWGETDHTAFINQTLSTRNLIRSEVFSYVDGTSIKWSNPAKYVYINFIEVPENQESNYLDIEKYVWKPIHESLQEDRKMASWTLWDLWFYTHHNYKFMTMNSFYEYKDIDSYNYSDAFQKVHQGKDLQTMFRNTNAARTSVKTELWELVDFVCGEE